VRRYRTSKPCLILLMGVAGTGKSTLAREILRRVSAIYLDNNQIVDAFFPDTRRGAAYQKLRSGFYKALYTIAEQNLELGNSVLLDVPHVKEVRIPSWHASIEALVKRTQSKLIVIRCHCSEHVLRRRIETRNESRDAWKLKHWKEFVTEQPVRTPIPLPHLDVDTEKKLSENITMAVLYIRQQAGKAAAAQPSKPSTR
jgi:predicted kinase